MKTLDEVTSKMRFGFLMTGAVLTLAACGVDDAEADTDTDTGADTEDTANENEDEQHFSLTEEGTTLVTEVLPYGEVVTAIAVDFSEYDEQTFTPDDFVVETEFNDEMIQREITDVFYSDSLSEWDSDGGSYLIIDLNEEDESAATLSYDVEGEYNVRRDLVYQVSMTGSEMISVTNEYQLVVSDFDLAVFEPSSGEELDYYLFEPEEAEDRLPLVVFLHGNGERGPGNQMNLLANEGGVVWARNEQQKTHPAYILAPQAPTDGQESFIWAEEPRNTSVKELVDATIETHNIDEDRVYLVGISQGTMGTWRLIEKYSEAFAAAVPIAGSTNHGEFNEENFAPVNTDYLEEYFALPTWSFGAADDTVVPPDNIQELHAIAQERGIDHFNYTEYEDGTVLPFGHFAWVPALQDTEMIHWLFSQERGSDPIDEVMK